MVEYEATATIYSSERLLLGYEIKAAALIELVRFYQRNGIVIGIYDVPDLDIKIKDVKITDGNNFYIIEILFSYKPLKKVLERLTNKN
ncbi:MAG: hypothetical protein QXM68_04370 [Candidatus Aenigmatarchaeota archaeon]|nr:hypothetical protein [Candidatus Aenigmarchaeota archaeon]